MVSYCVIAGPTASGKSGLALELAKAVSGELVNCDSVQVYRGFNIGAAKPSAAEQRLVPHHLFDIVSANESFDAADYADRAAKVIADIKSRGRMPIVVGGTGFYLRALWGQAWDPNLPSDPAVRARFTALSSEELYQLLQHHDPERAKAIHPNDHFRLARAMELVTLIGGPLSSVGFGSTTRNRDSDAFVVILDPPRSVLHERIARRSSAMLGEGLIEEVQSLLKSGIDYTAKPMQSIGYKEVCAFLQGELREDDLTAAIATATRQYAKRQCTWFRRVEADLRLTEPDVAAVLKALQL